MENQHYRSDHYHDAESFQRPDYEKWMFRATVLVAVVVVLLVYYAYFLA